MTSLLYIAFYAAILCFVFGCVRRVLQYASLPVHLRWELYPVPHEPPARANHGGSYFEVSDWWTQPRHLHRAGELRVMLAEILFLKSVRESNRKLWWRSQLFHAGLYCITAACAVQVLLAAISLTTAPIWIDSVARPAAWLGRIGLAFAMLGALALLIHRLREHELRDYTHPADYVHLAVIAATAALFLTGSTDRALPSALDLIRGALTFDTGVHVPGVLAGGMLLTLALLAYVPYSQMAHFIGKYFAFHAVRWDDAPNHGGKFAKEVSTSLALHPTWSAGHISGGGNKSWAEIASADPAATDEVRR